MKKRICTMTLATLICLSLSACGSGVKQEVNESVKTELSDLQSEHDSLKKEKESIESDLEAVKAEYAAYKEKMSPYEAIEQADAEARLREIEESKAAEEAARAQAEAEEKARQEAEAAMGYETGITYDQLARTPDEFTGQKVKFYGKVIQVIEGDGTVQIRLAVDDNYDTILFGEYASSIVSSRVLEDDYITIYGVSYGLITYQSTMGGNISIPGVIIEKIDQY